MNDLNAKYPKLLILCHNMYENTNNIGKTLISLLDFWPKDKLCEVYLRDDVPSFDYCYDYYRILDKEIVKSYTKGKKVVGKPLKKGIKIDGVKIDQNENNMYNLGNKRIPAISLFRDLLWKKKSWKNPSFDKWLEEQKPDIVLFVPNDYELIYPIAKYIVKKLNIPLIPYYMDDAFYYNMFISPIDYFRRLAIRKKAKQLLKNVPTIITIGPKMSKVYSEKFNKKCVELMNSVQLKEPIIKKKNDQVLITYVGNLHSNRWKSIVEIGKSLDSMNKNVILEVYSASFISKTMDKAFNSVKSIRFMGKIMPEEVNGVLYRSDILLFVESFIKKSKASTKYSLSTKIPEYLNACRCIFAYGPSDISSMEYLRDNNLAFTCTSKKHLKDDLSIAINNIDKLDINRIINFVDEKHNIEKNRELIKQVIFERIKNEDCVY